jgi:hypothetical protein
VLVPGKGSRHLRHVEAGLALDVGIDGVSRRLALLLGKIGLHFEKRGEEFVRVLDGTEGHHSRGVDFVLNRDFAIQARVAGVRILFEIADLCLNILGAAPDGADGGHGVDVGAVHELDSGVVGIARSPAQKDPSRRDGPGCTGAVGLWTC